MRSIDAAFRLLTATVVCFIIVPAFALTDVLINDPGRVLTDGHVIEIDGINNTIEATVGFDNSVRIDTSFDGWRFSFDNVGDGPLLEGVYEEATRYPFQSVVRPGLDASGGGRGCNTLTGRFVILEILYGAGGDIDRFAADLALKCDGSFGVFRASIRINSDLPLILEQPTASAGRDRIVLERDEIELSAQESVGGTSSIASYRWTQTDGPAVNLLSATSSDSTFEAPTVTGAPVLLTFAVEVVNDDGLVDTDSVVVEVRDRSAPRSSLTYSSTPSDPVGQGASAFFTEDDGVFAGSAADSGTEATITFAGDEDWRLEFIANIREPLTNLTDYLVDYRVTHPHVYLSRNTASCFERDGTFYVYSYTRGPNPDVLGSLSVEFERFCNGSDTQRLSGLLHYQSVLPEANAGASRNEPERTTVRLDAGMSVDLAGTLELYEWTQLSGPPVVLESADGIVLTFSYELGDEELEQAFEFRLIVTDESGLVDSDTVAITIVQDNAAPVATDDQISSHQGYVIDFNALANDSDVDGVIDASRVAIVDAPSDGILANAGGNFTYIPPLSFSGTTTATYVIYDNDGAQSNTATITFEVAPGPLAMSDSATTEAGVAVTVDVLANDVAAGAAFDLATLTIVQAPSGGSVTANGDGSVTYTPFEAFSGLDFIGYDIADANGLRTPMTFAYITVAPSANAPPAPPPAPAPAPAPTQTQTPATTVTQAPARQTEVCSDVSPLSGKASCGEGSLSPLGLFALGCALVGIRRRAKSGASAESA
ncbi:MAG: Ig-like domain-containing protein [Gammaproteobacteria bacterium]|nr:Ig-like domain-containing protein [Gammaproteobacteria bacterium]